MKENCNSDLKDYNRATNKCVPKSLENEKCNNTIQCVRPMVCASSAVCKCVDDLKYHNLASFECLPKNTFKENCVNDLNCRDDLNLKCVKRECVCTASFPQWSDSRQSCIVPSTYDETCGECDINTKLVCNAGKCNCVREINNEYYWNGLDCVPAHGFGESCLESNMCRELTEQTICDQKELICKCKQLQYFDKVKNKCENQLMEGDSCLKEDACRSDLGLKCELGICKCDSLIQYWNVNKCVDSFTYNTGSCLSDEQCVGNLICKKPSTSSCRCPSNVATGRCDCPPRAVGSEFYYNGTTCVPALTINMPCESTNNYMCNSMTEFLECTGPAPFTCQCNILMYYNYNLQKCVVYQTIGEQCSQTELCRPDLGLICQGGICECDSNSKWNGQTCK